MSLVQLSIDDLLRRFSSSDPTPGGGSASAVASAIGASLLMMVAALPKTRSGSDDDRAALARAASALPAIRERLAAAIDEDTAAYDGVVATLLPIAAFYLKLGRFAPARMLVERGVAVALATDVNPGAGFSPSMPFALSLACFGMGLTFEEALVGATINAAYSLDRHERVGSLEPGKQLDAVVVAGPAIDLIRVGAETIRMVIKRGQIVTANS